MKEADLIVHWPGKDTPACLSHANQLIALGKHMGFVVTATACFEDVPCANCENEQKKSKGLDK